MNERRPRSSVKDQRKSEAAERAWADPEVRQRMRDGQKRGWGNPEIRQRRIEGLRRAWANPEISQRRIDGMRRAAAAPEERQRKSERMKRAVADPGVRQRIREGLKASWTPELRAAKSRLFRKLWDERKAALQAAGRRPVDWWKKPIKWRIIGDVLLSRDGCMSNQELGKALDTAQLIQCPYGNTWAAALSSDATAKSDAATALVTKIRRWVNKPGSSSRAKIAVNNFSQSA